ncbi:vir region protein [Legionella geestiana]|uniref:Translational regulator CsrA n=1 Tax=Legionella geestiana TaxID=45065 RepID=A0A0W0U976_9GAMM|nr:carbon storage regulator [Legionella geestiana]KTD04448.1 vir region protein [Legionella geestiana]QBS12906.1 carbon storage regulator [Legionella geestiana]QDQ39413.1 carbon storage regulator [Legionella geestiana]STX54600.1 vir region protein [Legionella geestiana]
MLVLTRRIGEQILIDKGQIEIKMLYVRNGHIAVGIKAPAHIDVDRKEIFIRKQAAKQDETVTAKVAEQL